MKTKLLYSLLLALFISCDDDSTSNNSEKTTLTVRIENTSTAKSALKSGVFNTPVGDASAGPATPGKSYQFEFTAGKGSMLSFATMYVQSNDWFFAPKNGGLKLYDDNGNKITGDITSMINLYDAGTEVDQTPGEGADQPPRSTPNTGAADANSTVRAAEVPSGFPTVNELVEVRLESLSEDGFRLIIENISGSSTLASPLAPGVFAIHSEENLLFETGMPDKSNGLEGLAEDGVLTDISQWLTDNSGVNTIFTPGVYTVHKSGMPLFEVGQADFGNGLEQIAEGGDISVLSAHSSTTGSFGTAPVGPGGSVEFMITVEKGDRLSFATMFVESNDWIFSSPEDGMNLWNSDSSLKTGDYSSDLKFYDLGTEIDQEPGVGADQPLRGGGALDAGADDSNTAVRAVAGDHANVKSHIRITISN